MIDNDSANWTITGDATVVEGADASYTVSLNGFIGNGENASVELSLADIDTAIDDRGDLSTAIAAAVSAYAGNGSYAWDGTTLTWTANAEAQEAGDLVITLTATDNAILEGDEDFSISLANPGSTSDASILLGASTSVTTTITDDDTATVSIAPTNDGDEEGPVNGLFTVSISDPADTDTVVNYTVGGTATSGVDFTALSGQVTILAGQTTATIVVPVIDDTQIEADETVSVTLTSIAAGDPDVSVGGTSTATINILDDDSAAWLLVGDATTTEGGSPSYTLTFTGLLADTESAFVDISLADIDTSSADYASINTAVGDAVTAYSGPGSFAWDGTTITWTADANDQTPDDLVFTLGTVDDAIIEADEAFTISLANPGGAGEVTLGVNNAVTTSINDNDSGNVSITDVTVGYEDGTDDVSFVVTLSQPSSTDTVISYDLSGTAVSGSDYVAASGTVTILAGDTVALVTLPVIDDAIIDGLDEVDMQITAVTSGDPDITFSTAVVTSVIIDNDTGVWSITGDTSVSEGTDASYDISLSGTYQAFEIARVEISLANIETLGIDYADFNAAVNSAILNGPGNYSWNGTRLSWFASVDNQTPGVLTIDLGTIDDAIVEGDESFSVSLSNPSSDTSADIVLGASTAVTTTITDNDTATVSIAGTTDGDEAGLVRRRVYRHSVRAIEH